MNSWSPDTEEGGTIWTSGDVHELIDEHRRDGESPNQCLKRVLGDEPVETSGEPQVKEEVIRVLGEHEDQIRDLARDEARDVVEEERRRNH